MIMPCPQALESEKQQQANAAETARTAAEAKLKAAMAEAAEAAGERLLLLIDAIMTAAHVARHGNTVHGRSMLCAANAQ